MRAAARRYKGAVHSWQIENEVTSRTFWDSTVDEYVEVLRTAHRVIKREDPSARVVLAGIAADVAVEWLSVDAASASKQPWVRDFAATLDYILQRASGAFDVVDVHLYLSPNTMARRLDYVRARMAAAGSNTPIWVTETGGPDTRWPYDRVPPGQGPADTRYHERAPDTERAEVIERLVIALGAGAERVFWHSLRTPALRDVWDGTSLIRAGEQTPAFAAYQQVASTLQGFTSVRRLDLEAGVSAYIFETPHGGVTAIWGRQPATIHLAGAPDEVTVTDVQGRISLQPARALQVTSSPIFVER